MRVLADIWGVVRDKFPPNRVVVLLTPLVFAPAAGFVTVWVGRHFPGLPAFSSAQLMALFVTGALIALAKAYAWLNGWQKHEERAFYGHSGPGSGDKVEIALIEAETKKVIALIEAGHLPADVGHLLNGSSGALGGSVPPPAPNPGSVPTSLPPRPPTAA